MADSQGARPAGRKHKAWPCNLCGPLTFNRDDANGFTFHVQACQVEAHQFATPARHNKRARALPCER